jgi:hypothetical protein
MIQYIKQAATASGISSVITNSEEKIETQLNSLTKEANTPIMLVSWDIDTDLNFDDNGFLENPSSVIVALLVKKASDMKKETMEAASDEMGLLYQVFLKNLYEILSPLQRSSESPITGASFKRVPNHGAGKHSGILCRWSMKSEVSINQC